MPGQVRGVAVSSAAISRSPWSTVAIANFAGHILQAASACAASWTMLLSIAYGRRRGGGDPRPRIHPLINPVATTRIAKRFIIFMRNVQATVNIGYCPIPGRTGCATLS